ncbi:MAG TPA: PspC domain-containing protein [Candidatus Dojkabacteria bacterium]|nr:PspC domain-containing protein [Candidatus Dojkabacteria bacterium]
MEKKSKKSEGKKETKKAAYVAPKRLVRSKTDQIIAGVCGGIAEYFEIDPIIVRLLFALLVFSGGSGVLIYIILWIIMPEKGDENKSHNQVVKENAKDFEQKVEQWADSMDKPDNRKKTQLWFGVAIVVLGTYLTLQNFGIGSMFNLGWYIGKFWPLIIVGLGVIILVKRDNGNK